MVPKVGHGTERVQLNVSTLTSIDMLPSHGVFANHSSIANSMVTYQCQHTNSMVNIYSLDFPTRKMSYTKGYQ